MNSRVLVIGPGRGKKTLIKNFADPLSYTVTNFTFRRKCPETVTMNVHGYTFDIGLRVPEDTLLTMYDKVFYVLNHPSIGAIPATASGEIQTISDVVGCERLYLVFSYAQSVYPMANAKLKRDLHNGLLGEAGSVLEASHHILLSGAVSSETSAKNLAAHRAIVVESTKAVWQVLRS